MNEEHRRYHPVANLFPLMTGEAFESLKADIAQQGQLEAIWLHPDGSIIDGRNRHRACVELGIVPRFRTWDGSGSLVAFVVSLNLHRRHLDAGQRAMIGLKVKEALAQEIAQALPEKGREAIEKRWYGPESSPIGFIQTDKTYPSEPPRSAQAEAAEVMSVGKGTMARAEQVAKHAPDLAEQVANGNVKLNAAYKEVKRRRKEEEYKERLATRQESTAPMACRLIVARAEATTLEPESVDIIITSPPYNLGDETWPMGGEGRTTRDGIDYISHGDDLPQAEYERWQVDVLREMYRVAKPGASFFYNHKVRTVNGEMIHPMRWLLHPDNPWTLRQEIIWDRKSTHNHSATLFWPIDERIYWMTKGRPAIRSQAIGRPTIWQWFGPVPNTWHPAPFCEQLPQMLLEAIGVDESTVVLDPFAGSCTTLKVALELGCQAVGVDISSEYLQRAIVENGWSHECLYESAKGVAFTRQVQVSA